MDRFCPFKLLAFLESPLRCWLPGPPSSCDFLSFPYWRGASTIRRGARRHDSSTVTVAMKEGTEGGNYHLHPLIASFPATRRIFAAHHLCYCQRPMYYVARIWLFLHLITAYPIWDRLGPRWVLTSVWSLRIHTLRLSDPSRPELPSLHGWLVADPIILDRWARSLRETARPKTYI
jgi:hypothetical protein